MEYADLVTPLPERPTWSGWVISGKGHDARGWAVLSALFERIEVTEGKVTGIKPRADRVGRVRLLINTAIDYADSDFNEGDLSNNPGASSGSGKGEAAPHDWLYRVRIA